MLQGFRLLQQASQGACEMTLLQEGSPGSKCGPVNPGTL